MSPDASRGSGSREAAGLTGPSPAQDVGCLRDWLAAAAGFTRRRISGAFRTDEFGFDPDFNATLLMPLTRMLYRGWFRTRMRGVEHIPAEGPGLVVANHSGVLPIDMVMVQTGVFHEHPAHRNLRLLGADLLYAVPLLAQLARRSGHTLARPVEAARLLARGELVGVCPEGFKGTGKPFSQRYQLARFGRGGFAATALRAGVPIIPCAIVGAEEIYPMLADAKPLARLLGLPYFPVTPLFPWLGPLGMVPLPSNWIIEFCPPVSSGRLGPAAADDPAIVSDLAGHVRDVIQAKVNDLVAERGPAFG